MLSEADQVAHGGRAGLHFKKNMKSLPGEKPSNRELNTAKWPQREADTGPISQGLIEAVSWVWLLMRGNE